uniref:Uncharacterized protein n=1 Tax=Cacopsylla melanoneura TaxID=428564 RepID=A0A8D8Y3H1_9HEMI
MFLRHVPAHSEFADCFQKHDRVLAARRGDHVRKLGSHGASEHPPDEDDEGSYPVHVQTSGDVAVVVFRYPMHSLQPSSLHVASPVGRVHTRTSLVSLATLVFV